MSNALPIYLDANATTMPFESVLEEVNRVARIGFANPGSVHADGMRARNELRQARSRLATLLDCDEDHVVLTSGGTEAINLALIGRAQRHAKTADTPGTIVRQRGDHPAGAMCAKHLSQQGWREVLLDVNQNGQLDFDAIAKLNWQPGDLLTILLAHNETGVLQDTHAIASLAEFLRSCGVWTHVDAVQAIGKINVRFRQLNVDAMSIASHKFHGLRGVGALLLRDRSQVQPLFFGGGQEYGLRPGTPCVALVAGMAKALEACLAGNRRERAVRQIRDAFEARLMQFAGEENIQVIIHGRQAKRLPNTCFVSFPQFSSSPLVNQLAQSGVYCSSGSACKSDMVDGSEILLAMQCVAPVAGSAVRFSFDADLEHDVVETIIHRLAGVIQILRDQKACDSSHH